MLNTIKSQLTTEREPDDDTPPQQSELLRESPRADSGSVGDDAAATQRAPQEPMIELDEVFGLLKNRRRRDVLRHLLENSENVRLGELAEVIAARECGKPVAQLGAQERKRVYVGLYQCHLPKLADAGVIDYNKPRGVIERGPCFDQVTQYLPAEETPLNQDGTTRPLVESLTNLILTDRFSR